MHPIFNISFTRVGSSRGYCLLLLACICVTLNTRAQSAMGQLDSLRKHYQKTDDVENFIYACLDHFLSSPEENRLPIFDLYDKQVWRPLKTTDEKLAFVVMNCNRGFYMFQYGNIYDAIDAYEKAWQIYQVNSLTGFDIIEYCLKPLGNGYTILGDYASAESIIKTYQFIANQWHLANHQAGASINLSIVYSDTGHPQKALDELQRIEWQPWVPNEKKGLIFSNLARNFVKLKESQKAVLYANQAIKFLSKYQQFDTPIHMVNSHETLAQAALLQGDTASSMRYFTTAFEIVQKNQSAFKARDLAKLFNEYAQILSLANQQAQAIVYYQKALQAIIPSFKPSKSHPLPDQNLFYAENAIKEALDGMGDTYLKMNQAPLAVSCFELSFTIEDLLRETFNYQEATLLQQIENRERTEKVLTLLYGMQNTDSTFAHRAFQVAERTKALTLKDMTQRSQVRQSIDKDPLVTHEQQLLFKQASLYNDLAVEQSKPEPDSKTIHQLQERQAQLVIRIKEVRQSLQDKYPQYHSQSSSSWIDIRHLQSKLGSSKSALVEYFMGDSYAFRFVVRKSSVEFELLENNLNHRVKEYLNLFVNSSAINNDIESYKSLSYDLFHSLFPNETITENSLIIIPDGVLHLLPFEALLFEKPPGISYQTFSFLLKKYTLAYETSALLYSYHPSATASHEKSILGIFPIFENSPLMLTYSIEEAATLENQFALCELLMRNQATKAGFMKKASQHQLIHLSTHANAGNSNNLPFISFIDSTLSLSEIYGLQLKADLVVLSACETGIGQLAKGEGAISLAHGFKSAGAKNLIISLWNVHDKSTAYLFNEFYKHYNSSGNKSLSLQQAKIMYLQSESIPNSQKSPYYWAAFAYYGDHQPPKAFVVKWYWWVTLGSILLAVAIAIRMRRSR